MNILTLLTDCETSLYATAVLTSHYLGLSTHWVVRSEVVKLDEASGSDFRPRVPDLWVG